MVGGGDRSPPRKTKALSVRVNYTKDAQLNTEAPFCVIFGAEKKPIWLTEYPGIQFWESQLAESLIEFLNALPL